MFEVISKTNILEEMSHIKIQFIITIIIPSGSILMNPPNNDAQTAALIYVIIIKMWSAKTLPVAILVINFENIAVIIPNLISNATVTNTVENVENSKSAGKFALSLAFSIVIFTKIINTQNKINFIDKFKTIEVKNNKTAPTNILVIKGEAIFTCLTLEYLDLVFLIIVIFNHL